MAVSFMIVSTDNGLLYLKWYFKDSGVLELTVAQDKKTRIVVVLLILVPENPQDGPGKRFWFVTEQKLKRASLICWRAVLA